MKSVIFVLLAFLLNFSVSLFLRVETGHQNIAIDGRDTYYGHFTKIYFHNLTCINSIDINCLKELTGAEEIDLLYSECQRGASWKVAHYTNSKQHFRIKEPIQAFSLLISSRIDLSIIDVQVQSCKHHFKTTTKPSECDRTHRHSNRNKQEVIKAHDNNLEFHKRSKRSSESHQISGNLTIEQNIIVEKGELLTIVSGAKLKFSKGVGIIVKGRLHINGTTYNPVHFESINNNEKWNGIYFENGESGSVISNILISGSETGIKVEKGFAPYMDHIIVQKNNYGIQMKDLTTPSYLHKITSIKNEKTGIEYVGKGILSIDNCVTASNGGLGIFAKTSSKITIRKSTSYSNNGTGIYIGTRQATIEDSVLNSNSHFGLHSEISENLDISNVNISAHFLNFAIDCYLTENAQINIFQSHFFDNKIGSIRLSGNYNQPSVKIRDSKFIRNSGAQIIWNDLENGKIEVEHSEFLSNSGKENSTLLFRNITDGKVIIDSCEFAQNKYPEIIRLQDLAIKGSEIQISNSKFFKNVANSIIFTNSPSAEISNTNQFENPKTDCDLTFTLPRIMKSSDENLRLCSGEYHSIQSDQPKHSENDQNKNEEYIKFTINQDGIIKSAQTPYLVEQEIYVDDKLIFEPGTILDFAPGIGITVHQTGQFIINGTSDKPVVLRGRNGNIWRGIVAKPDSKLDLNNMILEDPSIGLWIDSKNVKINGGRINHPIVHGIEITYNSNENIDLGGIEIESSSESAIGIDERRNDLSISNARIKNGQGSGIDFVTPTQNIEIRDVNIINMGSYGIHISEFPSTPLHSVLMSNVSILEQKRGSAGILISGGWLKNVSIHNSKFSGNSVPSLIIAIECNDDSEKLIRIENSSFYKNQDIVQHVQLGECVNVQMERNNYESNNLDGIGSTVVITTGIDSHSTDSVVEISKNNFTSNSGIYSLTLGKGTIMYVTDNEFMNNSNSGAVIKVEGQDVKLVTNTFNNPKTQYTINYNEETPLEVGYNNWKQTENIIDLIDAPKQSIRISETMQQNQTQLQIDSPPYSANEGCAHLKYCSHRGTCRDSICICPHGFTGFDCSISVVCNCSGNGLCDLFNNCICNGGWSGNNCEIPKCYKDCNGKGKCVGPNQCECNKGWIGESCTTTTCIDSKCLNGHCSDGLCKCENGWKGSRCQVPICNECSLNGQCTKPDNCECFDGFYGNSCIQKEEECDFDCDNGICNENTKTCSCHGNWSGGACDICKTKDCDQASTVSFIQPSTAHLEDTNTVVTVFGTDFNKTPNNSYICTFGRTTVLGVRITSGILRCPVPANMTLGRHLFTVSKPNSFETISHSPIHFTIFDGCDPSICQGSCSGPLCICPQGKTGILCDVIELIPTIDQKFLQHQKVNEAFEGTPYVVMLPTLSSSVLRVNSTIPGLNFISSKGILAWPEPIGSLDPYSVTVTAFSPAGESNISWNVTVRPEYSAKINNIEVKNGVAIINGTIMPPNSVKRKVPIVIRVLCNGIVDEILSESEISGNIEYSYIPMAPGTCSVSIFHPADLKNSQNPTQFTIPEFNMKVNGHSDDSSLQIQVVSNSSNCKTRLIKPFGKSIESFESGSEVILKYDQEWQDEVFAWVKCGDSPIEIVHAPANEIVTVSPNYISTSDPANQQFELEIKGNPNAEIKGPIREKNREQINNDITRVTIELTQTNGLIEIGESNITIVSQSPDYSLFKICARDEWDGQEHALSTIEVATITISNPQKGVLISKPNIRLNVQWAEFTIIPGIYSLQIQSESHYPFEQIINLDTNNSTFCVDLRSSKMKSFPSLQQNGRNILSIKNFGEDSLPYLKFSPSLVTIPGQKILVTPKGNFDGTIGLWNQKIDPVFEILPNRRSVMLNQSFWITVIWDLNQISEDYCDVNQIEIPFVFLPKNGDLAIRLSSPILVEIKPTAKRICDSNNQEIEIAMLTKVKCNCGDGIRSKCRNIYRPANACDNSWLKISDDTVSLEVLISFLSMLFECTEVSVNFHEIRQSLECVASIENNCPIGNRVKRNFQMDSPVNIVNHLASVKMDLGKVLPILNALDVQTIRISTVFIDFIDQLEKVFPSEYYHNLNRNQVDQFIKAISDDSESSNYISEKEFDVGSKDLMNLWNNTVRNWKSGKESILNNEISYLEAKKLVQTSDKLKSITRQNGATNPFEMLNGYMGRMLETSGDEQKECASGLVSFEKTEIEEGGNVRVRVFVENLSNSTLTNIGVKLSFEGDSENIRFELGPSWSSGIQSLNGMGNLGSTGNFEIHWTRYPIITLAFSNNGRQTQQKLASPEIRIIPKKTVKAINIIRDELSPPSLNFSLISSIINPGYSTLSNLQIIIDSIKMDENIKDLEVEDVRINGKPAKSSLRQRFDEMHSGTTKSIRIALKNMIPIKSANITCIENNKLLTMESIETYAIRASGPSDYGMLLAPPHQTVPLFFFQQSSAQINNVIKLEYLSSQQVKIADPDRTIYMAAFKNSESSSFNGALWATMPIPELPGEKNKLIRIIEHSSSRPRELQAVQWFSKENDVDMINWIDSGLSIPQKVKNEESDNSPEFDEVRYRIEVPIGSKNQEIGQIIANGDGLLEYSLFSPNNDERYSIDSKTGKIYQKSGSEPPSDIEYCLVLEAKDSKGRTSRVPVSINNGGMRNNCNLFSIDGLRPLIFSGIIENHTSSPIPIPTTSIFESTHSTFPDSTLESVTTIETTTEITDTSTEVMSSTTFETSVPTTENIPENVTNFEVSTLEYASTSETSTDSTPIEITTLEGVTDRTSSSGTDIPETTTDFLTTSNFESTQSTSGLPTTSETVETGTETTIDYSSTTMLPETSPTDSETSESPTTPYEVTGILPTDPTTQSTTELIYTVTSDSNLEPITQPIFTITPDPSPETLRTIKPDDSSMTTVSTTIETSTEDVSELTTTTTTKSIESTTLLPAIQQACELVAQSPIYKIVCDLSNISESTT
ncbi:unnamed protein product [Caenorhabditis angaria]|uniref:EGF-like domain-containing protein n=1 Tax=Caenorhabditis angaria TaxID=860376 RepID=A0A9P1ITL2_9PELO|nr:unnamed protein product [Caenorhabditis angaria]